MGADGDKKLIDELYDEIHCGIGEAIIHLREQRANLKKEDLGSYLQTLGKAAQLMKALEKKPVKDATGKSIKIKGERELGHSSKKYLTKA
jgi:hypothetical protein